MNVPVLRFPEFEGDWKFSKLNQHITKIGSGVTPRGGAEVYQSSGVPLIRSQNVRNDSLDLTDVAYISDEINNTMKGSAVQPLDVLLNITGASIGRSCVVPADFQIGNVNQHVCIIRLKSDTSPNFLQSFLVSYRGQKLVFQSQSGSGREGLNFENIGTFKIAFPTLPEQKKIAAVLEAVNIKLLTLRRKRDLLKKYKRGLMQKLFTCTLRFTDANGQPFPDWEEKRLGEVAFTTTGDSNREDSLDEGEYVFFDRSEDIRRSPRYLFDGEAIIVAGEGKEFVPRYFVGKFDLHQRTYAIMQFESAVMGKYLFYYIFYRRFLFKRVAVGSTVPSLRLPMFQKFPVLLPHLDEQQKIADALSAVDAKIAAIANQVEKFKKFKKGLLQQMFV